MCASLLTGCAFPIPPPQTVNVPVPVSCLPDPMPARPMIASEAELAALDDYKFTLAIFLERRSLLNYVAEIDGVLMGCR